MANPNLVNATNIVANTSLTRLTTTTESQLATNASSSNKVYLLDSVYVSNADGTTAADITINLYANTTNSGTATKLAHTVSVPADAVLLPVVKDGTIVLLENMSIYAQASAGNVLHVVTSWKEIS